MRYAEISQPTTTSARIRYGVRLLTEALGRNGYRVRAGGTGSAGEPADPGTHRIVIDGRDSEVISGLESTDQLLYTSGAPGPDGFYLAVIGDQRLVITGGNDNGVLYGCQELARVLDETEDLPRDLDHGETPDLTVRGPAVGLQKTTVEPPRQTYEYPITPDRFAWFYDRSLWTDFLDLLFEQRANVIYLWSGHPFSSFVRLPDYPEALEVTEDELAANTELLHWLTTEADKRGIWVVLKFYNIHIPLPFAEHHRIPLRQPKPTPLVSDYTRAAIAAFVRTFPNVGLYVCLGETLHGDTYGAEWLIDTILPAVLDGAAGRAELPPVILRAHALDLGPVLDKAKHHYPRLLTEAKYNGESLTTVSPRGKWQQIHRELASSVETHIANVHILANLEPFRYGAVSFIRRSVLSMLHRLDAGGLHLYPLFYWEWPYSPDRSKPRLRQLDRDRIWYEAWFRYAWKADRDPRAERRFWIDRLAEQFGSSEAGRAALDGYEALGQIAPRLVRRLGITEGNRQTLNLGMTMSQLINPSRHRAWADLWESQAPQGERLDDYVRRELSGEPHVGETPLSVIDDCRHFAERARRALDEGWSQVDTDACEYARLCSDAEAMSLIVEFYRLRVSAAIDVLTYRHQLAGTDGTRVTLLEQAASKIDTSLRHYRELAALTANTYLYANSMQTPQRKVPFRDGRQFGQWQQCLPEFEAELENFKINIRRLAIGAITPGGSRSSATEPFVATPFTLTGGEAEVFTVKAGASVFADADGNLRRVAPELDGLQGVRINKADGFAGAVPITITLDQPAQLLIGYFRDDAAVWVQPPNLETDTHADDRGGLDPVLRRGLEIDFHPPVDVHALRYEAGTHVLDVGRGAYLIAGVVSADQAFTGRTAGESDDQVNDLDWLFDEPDA
ncbi:hypothetical protein FOE78_15235 [Microlunatus elymi]|uniref:Glycosyl hydrolase family 20, domain 2 n=1 Tax=Microlunatus elymi TaxID=2596828 RepID=A0A516Q0Y9_9ACTN|nr:hypothetical protein [Microlunatus elymi]QDP97099.1 hypothetical protein FOE78_15235 [Microlunatus elymi]